MINIVKGHASVEVKMTAAAEPTNISIQRGGGRRTVSQSVASRFLCTHMKSHTFREGTQKVKLSIHKQLEAGGHTYAFFLLYETSQAASDLEKSDNSSSFSVNIKLQTEQKKMLSL